MFDNTGAVLGNLTDTTRFYSRTVECSRDGSKAYFAGYTGHCIIRYTGDPLSGFVADTVLKGFDCESMCRAGKTDLLWASAGSGNDVPNQYGNAKTKYASHTWYLWNPTTNKIQDSIKWNGLSTFSNADSVTVKPRGVATTTNGRYSLCLNVRCKDWYVFDPTLYWSEDKCYKGKQSHSG